MSRLSTPPQLDDIDDGWEDAESQTEAFPSRERPEVSGSATESDATGALRARVVELERELATTSARVADLEANARELELRIAAYEGELEAARAARTALVAELEVVRASAALAQGDDLQAIHGIGPKLSKKLVALGVTRFADLARLDAAGIDELAEQLGIHRGRIERDGWVASARRLCGQDPG